MSTYNTDASVAITRSIHVPTLNTPSLAAAKIVHIFTYLGGKLQTKDDKIYLLSQEDATQTQVLPLHDPSTFPP